MSAIFGILRFNGAPVSERDLARAGKVLAQRGREAGRLTVQGPIGLGHCLLRVNKEDMFERQPLRDIEADLVLVADCRIDNREELAAALRISAQRLRDMPDSALVLRAYKEWGETCAEQLLGDFAFAVWDGRAQKLVLARDHMGQRSILYHRGKDFFAFASSFKALWTMPEVPQRVATEIVAARLMGPGAVAFEPGTTAFEDIQGLPGATVMTIAVDGAVASRRYWEPHPDPVHENRDEAYYIAAYRRVLGEAVDCRLRRLLHPPGMLLSGGYDSAAVAGLAGPAMAASGRKLIAVASVMPEDYRGTIRHARRWVEMCARDMPHLDVRFYTRDDLDLCADLERDFAETGLPAGPYSVVESAMTRIVARAGARVILDGHGGDYTLNPRGRGHLAYLLRSGMFRRLLTELRAHRHLADQNWRAIFLDEIAEPLLPGPVRFLRQLLHRRPPNWHGGAVNRVWGEQLAASGKVRVGRSKPIDPKSRMAATQRKVMDGAASGIGMERAHAVQLTRPFHDKRVVEFALAIPPELYVKNGRNRYLACAALADIYPPEFQMRWRKNDDEIPDFQSMVKSMEPRLLAEIDRMERSDELKRYIDFDKIRQLLATRNAEQHNSGWEQETQKAVTAFALARFLEWTRRRNT